MLGRTRALCGLCRVELQQRRSLSSHAPSSELSKLLYPVGHVNRKYRAGQEGEQISHAEVNRILKVRTFITKSVSWRTPQTDHLSSVDRPASTATLSLEDPPPMESSVSIATCFHLTTLARTAGAVPPFCQAVVLFSSVSLMATRGQPAPRPSARDSSTILLWQRCR